MAGLVDPREAEVAEFARLAVLDAVDDHGRVACGAESLGAREVGGQTDGFAAEPVADVVWAFGLIFEGSPVMEHKVTYLRHRR